MATPTTPILETVPARAGTRRPPSTWWHKLEYLKKPEFPTRHPERTHPQRGSANVGHKASTWHVYDSMAKTYLQKGEHAIESSYDRSKETDELIADIDALLAHTEDEFRSVLREAHLTSSARNPQRAPSMPPPSKPWNQPFTRPGHTGSEPAPESQEVNLAALLRTAQALKLRTSQLKRSPLAEFELLPPKSRRTSLTASKDQLASLRSSSSHEDVPLSSDTVLVSVKREAIHGIDSNDVPKGVEQDTILQSVELDTCAESDIDVPQSPTKCRYQSPACSVTALFQDISDDDTVAGGFAGHYSSSPDEDIALQFSQPEEHAPAENDSPAEGHDSSI